MSARRGGFALAPANCNNINKKSKNVLITRSLSLACCNLLAGVWKKKRHTAQTVETLLCQFVLLQLHFMHSPWSVNSQSVETHLLDFCLHLSLQRREKKPHHESHFICQSVVVWDRWARAQYLHLEVLEAAFWIGSPGGHEVELRAASWFGELSWFDYEIVVNTEKSILKRQNINYNIKKYKIHTIFALWVM